MAIIVGTNSYVTIEEADAFVSENFVSSNEQRIAWEALSDNDKEIYLRNATAAIERLKFTGVKYTDDQNLSFPRVTYDMSPEEVPQDICNAQVYEALELCHPTADSQVQKTTIGNVRSVSLGQISENYKSYDSNSIFAVISSQVARLILTSYLGGGYNVM